MLLYVTLGTRDLARAIAFYDPVMATLGYTRLVTKDVEAGYGREDDVRCRLWITYPFDQQPATHGNGSMLALAADRRAAVDAFHAAAIAQGGQDEGAPGLRPYHAHFYAAYARDPDGNKLSAVCETPE
ncbi:VOC family protein [Rhizobium sp. TRM95796]|uniref:VOC family protein n=1 Tax=Rhizobium sp. TRM95796 TaxID=2979862 RepID=UPI0021E7B246|nr:VOC family protein [Rhizobium sp. TRM95796]MCV3765870.1 VOC family protein [Rhizobium sp. TRM95796]